MDNNILNMVLRKKELFVPLIFTEKQFSVLSKYKQQLSLSNADKKALYTSVSKKIEALSSLSKEQKDHEYFVNGPNKIRSDRLSEAKKLIDGYSRKYEKVFISGSFLFSKEFKDIDIFIIRERGYREALYDNKHIIFLTEKRLCNPVFQSAALVSIANFQIPVKIKKKKPALSELMSTYHEAVIEFLQKEKKPESIIRLIFDYNLFCKNHLIDGKELNETSKKINLNELDSMIKELCITLFSETYLYIALHEYIKTLKESIRNVAPNTHLVRFKNTYEELIYGRQGSKAETA